MYPPKFDYHRAGSVAEAISLVNESDGKVLAGGHSLIPTMNLRLADPGTLVDIGRIDELKGISASNGSVRIGALATHAAIAASSDVPAGLSEGAGMIGDPQVRNRGTIGGNIAHADPASDHPTILAALGATINISGADGDRSVAAADFFQGLFETDLADGEIVTSVDVPSEGAGSGSSYVKLFNPASRYAMVGIAASVTVEGGTCTAASVAMGGLTPSTQKAPSVEAALVGNALDDATITAAAEAIANDIGDEVLGDIHASESYRRSMAVVFAKRAIVAAAERAG
ncbi:MAG: xanthine dehydrogenase family protein subunit M [Chloroflexota bacterium]